MPSQPHADAVAENFSAAAASYDHWAAPQRLSAQRLAAMIPAAATPGRILDAGCGTGALGQQLHQRFPRASLVGVDLAAGMIDACRRSLAHVPELTLAVADLACYEPSHGFDLIASNFSLHWLPDPAGVIRRFRALLDPAGLIALAVPVEGSLAELAESYRDATRREIPGTVMLSADAYLRALDRAGLRPLRCEISPLVARFSSGLEVLRYFRATGTTLRHQPDYRPHSVAHTRRLTRRYEELFADPSGRVPLTFSVLYLLAEAMA